MTTKSLTKKKDIDPTRTYQNIRGDERTSKCKLNLS